MQPRCSRLFKRKATGPSTAEIPGNGRYFSLSQINPTNVSTLVQAWVYDTRPEPSAKARRPAQTTPLEAKGVMNTKSLNLGGSVATAAGLLFIGATTDQRFHAYDSKSGNLLWETKLAATAEANPITYMGKNGKQYVVVNAGDFAAAFSLP